MALVNPRPLHPLARNFDSLWHAGWQVSTSLEYGYGVQTAEYHVHYSVSYGVLYINYYSLIENTHSLAQHCGRLDTVAKICFPTIIQYLRI